MALCAASLCHLIASFPGKVLLHAASRQPPSLWNCVSNILFRALSGRISVAHSYRSSIAAPNEARGLGRSRYFSYLSISLRYSAANPFSVWHRGLGGSQRSRGGRSKVAEQSGVSQEDQLSLLTPWWSHQHFNLLHLSTFQGLPVICGSGTTHIYCINTW